MSIDWTQEVKEYKEQYDDEDGIYEYIESLLPQYYGDIYQTYHDVIGTPLNITIEPQHVGIELWRIMNGHIYAELCELFFNAWNEAEEEEE
tara:strand:+ start:288 stop:560 length:273 start_codon:yes stop_codon:yes gene_type:complete